MTGRTRSVEGHDPTCPYLRYRIHRECRCGESYRAFLAWRDEQAKSAPARGSSGEG